ncbi:MAG: Uma2 family endonuclease [Bacteroidota bacterium]
MKEIKMGEAQIIKGNVAVADYFVLEAQAGQKYEYLDGKVLAMAGGTPRHSQLCANATRLFGEALDQRDDCIVYDSNLKIEVPSIHSFLYPDGSIVCGELQFSEGRKDSIQNPVLIIEVLSDSTESYDRGDKFRRYRNLPSLKEYVLISQNSRQIEVFFRKEANHWLYSVYSQPEEMLRFHSLGLELAVGAFYRKVEV